MKRRDEAAIQKELERWITYAKENDGILLEELLELSPDWERVKNAFYQDLGFGTGGMRGIMGAGSNRMNQYVVARASMGIADYINKRFEAGKRSVVIGYDSRINSSLFSKRAAEVFAACGIRVSIYGEQVPTPMVSWAVRMLQASAGVVITASHNSSEYNGYKVYGADGCQITTGAASEIFQEIQAADMFDDRYKMEFEEGVHTGRISYIQEDVITAYIEAVKNQSMLRSCKERMDRRGKIIYSPLNGTGLKPVLRTLGECGFTNIKVVEEQSGPDGTFPTCPYPNPESEAAMELGIEYARRYHADIVIATDPDCDRVGIAVRSLKDEYVLLSGNEVGILLLDFICQRRLEDGLMPDNPVAVKTIVTTDLAERIAGHYGVSMVNVLTGFKFIGEQIGCLEKCGCEDSFILGLEESYGYLTGTYVRDKDAVNGVLIICEMFAYYRTHHKSLLEVLDGIYEKYGYYLNTLHSYKLEGLNGAAKIQTIMNKLRKMRKEFAGSKILEVQDYLLGQKIGGDGSLVEIGSLPSADVLRFVLENDCVVSVRPSGTEPKFKVYISLNAESREMAQVCERELIKRIEEYLS